MKQRSPLTSKYQSSGTLVITKKINDAPAKKLKESLQKNNLPDSTFNNQIGITKELENVRMPFSFSLTDANQLIFDRSLLRINPVLNSKLISLKGFNKTKSNDPKVASKKSSLLSATLLFSPDIVFTQLSN